MGGLGRPTVRIIADRLKSQPWFKPQIIREINIGGRKYPLGRYLTRKLADDLGVSQESWDRSVYAYQLHTYQKGIKLEKEDVKIKNYYDAITKESKQKALNLEKKEEIYKKRRTI